MPDQDRGLSPLDDRELLRRSGGGDRAAFDCFLGRHQTAVWRYLRGLIANPADAEDVLQQTFIAAYRAAAGFRGEARARTWLLTIARRAAARLEARPERAVESEAELDRLACAAGWGIADGERLAQENLDRERLQRALDRLSPEDREVITLRDLEELTGEETARLLGLPLATVKSRLHRARLRLIARLRPPAGGATDAPR